VFEGSVKKAPVQTPTAEESTREKLLGPAKAAFWDLYRAAWYVVRLAIGLGRFGGAGVIVIIGGKLVERYLIEEIVDTHSRTYRYAIETTDAIIVLAATGCFLLGIAQLVIVEWHEFKRIIGW
jgi:hypothetical protein